jgi:aminoglycoside phosphotransferase (APT) family kinase protein
MSVRLAADLRSFAAEMLGHHGDVDVDDLRRIPGGASHETWSCDLRDGTRVYPVIVRRDIAGGLLENDGAEEFALLRTLHELGQPVPRQWLRAGGLTVMERVPGQDARKLMADDERGFDTRALGLELVSVQAGLHAVDWRNHRSLLPAPADEVERWAGVVEEHRGGAAPLLVAAISWLRANAADPAPPVVVHGDYKANNLLVSREAGVTVIDWEMTHLGDPLEDLAWTLLWDTRYDLVGGMLPRADYLRAYEHASGSTIDQEALFFWELHALVKLAGIFLTGVRRGAAQLPTLQMFGRSIPHVDHQIATRLGLALGRESA